MVKEVNEVKTSMTVVVKKLQEHGFLEYLHNDCPICKEESDDCDKLKTCMQELMNQGVIQFTNSKIIEEVFILSLLPSTIKRSKLKFS